ncbi:MAG: chromosomal replication initiator protein DnaA [Clostridia bacterium]|nr:chromosomal replication initiator protein DnaA [Clostridia bacterium]
MQTYDFIWESVVRNMRNVYTEIKIKTYFEKIRIVDLEPQYILLMTPDASTLEFVRSQQTTLERVIKQTIGEFKIVYVYAYDRDMPNLEQIRLDIKEDLDHPKLGRTPYMMAEEREEKKRSASPGGIVKKSDYTFENFVVGSSNRFVYNACLAVADNPASAWNPLFIYGPSGLGKTHLMHSISARIAEQFPDLKILYLTSEAFTNEVIESLRTKDGPTQFRTKYRSCDVLLIDDIQFIAGKDTTQEEFFHTFNELYEAHKQIVISSDRPPREIKRLDERLSGRFASGLTADVQPPDYELRMAIIKSKADAYKLDMPESSMVYLAEHLTQNIRQIEGALTKIFAKSYLYGIAVTDELVINSVSDLITYEASPKDVAEKIMSVVSTRYGTTKDEVKGKSKKREIVEARHVCAYLIRELTGYSLNQIGALLNRDHTTIMNSCEVTKTQIMNDPLFEKEIKDMIAEIKG